MSDTAYTIDLDDPTDPGEDSNLDQGLQPPDDSEDNAQDSDSHVGFAWQIEFSSSASTASKPKKQLPKFLRDREKSRAEKTNKEANKKIPHPSIDPKAPIRTLSESRRQERKISLPPTRSRTPLPLKAKSVPEVSPSARSAKSKDTRPFSSPTTRAQFSGKEIETSSKRSPPIKQPLLAVKSPRRGQSSASNTSTSNSSLLLRSPRRTQSANPSLSPRKAKDITAKQRSVSADKDVQSSTTVKSSSTVSSAKSGRASSVQRQLLTVEIPTGSDADIKPMPAMAVQQQDIEQRKVLDLKRWYCMCRPQYSKSCGISSVVSCWNYLFSTLGNGSHRPVTQEEALTLLGFKPPFGEIRFGPFTGNATCMRWFRRLCCHYGVCGQAYYLYKPVGKGKTFGLKPELALQRLKDGLRDPSIAFVYHCLNHYFCPIGYEDVPKMAPDAYKFNLADDDIDTWVLIGEPSRKQSSIHCKRWSDIVTDLSTKRPEFFNIRHTERGVQSKKTKRSGGNLHCIMAFRKLDDSSADFFVGPEITSGPQELQQSLSEVENLDSSDSDFPLSPKSSENNLLTMGTDVPDADIEAIETMNAFRVELGGKIVGQAINIPTQDLEYESVDKPEASRDLELTSVASNVSTVVGTTEHGEQNIPSVASQKTNLETSAEDIRTEHYDNSALYPDQSSPRLRSSTYIKQHVPVLEVKESESESSNSHPVSPSSIRRSGTFTKESKNSKPVINKMRPPSEYSSDQIQESGSESESSNSHQVSPSSIRRSGTFTKESRDSKPVINKTRPPSEYSSDQVQESGSESESSNSHPVSPSSIRRSGTFTKESKNSKPVINKMRPPSEYSSDQIQESGSESESSNSHQVSPSSIRRSGTFTKESRDSKPVINKTRPPSEYSSDQVQESGSESESSNSHPVSPSSIRRSGTFTKESKDSKPIIRKTRPPSEYSSDQDSEQDIANDISTEAIRRTGTFSKPGKFLSTLHVPGKGIPGLDVTDANNEPQSGSALRRSGTFTKEKPDVIVTSAYSSESSGSEEIDTVASKTHNKLELNTDYLTRSGTYTKQKPAEAHQCESDSSFEFEYFEGVDLDETLRAPTESEVKSDEEITVEETLVLPTEQDSYLKRSGTYTKHKPFLDV